MDALAVMLPFTALSTFLLLLLYLKKVERLMRLRGIAERPRPDGAGAGASAPHPARDFPAHNFDCSTPRKELLGGRRRLYRHANRAHASAAILYLLAGLAHASTALLVLLLLVGLPYRSARDVLSDFIFPGLAFLWPVVETQYTLWGGDFWGKGLAGACYVGLVFAGAWYTVNVPELMAEGFPYWKLAAVLVLMLFVPTSVKWAVMNTWLKAAGTAMLVLLSALAGGAMVGSWVGGAVGAGQPLRALLFVYALAGGFAVGCGSVMWLVRRHEGKRASDQTIVVDMYWLMLAEWLAFIYVAAFDWRGLLALLSFAGYAMVLFVGFRVRGRLMRGAPKNVRLLVLRTFTKGRPQPGRAGWLALSLRRMFGLDGGWLIRGLETRWRYVGSVQLIGGPDLASAYVDVDEFIDWARGLLGRRFIQSDRDLERRLEALDVRPDPDGRYRVNEFFCDDRMWGKALDRLINPEGVRRHAVLMDLRGFSQKNEGVTHELGQLIDKVLVERVVFVVDGEAGSEFLKTKLGELWAGMAADSPNRRTPEPALRFFRVRGRSVRAYARLFALLLRAAEDGAAVESGARRKCPKAGAGRVPMNA
jgi:hypothetical protein